METVAVSAGFMAFLTEMFAPLLLCSSIPLGSPPVQDPALGRAAPKQCVLYVGWAGIGTPDPKSTNSAERFLADPEIRHVRAEAAQRFRKLIRCYGKKNGPVGMALTNLTSSISSAELSDDAATWCELLVTRPCAGFISHLTQGDNAPNSHGGFVMNVGAARKKVAAMLHHYRAIGKDFIEESTVDGCVEYRIKENPTLRLRWTLRGKHFIVAWGDELPAEIAKRMKGPEPDWFAAIAKKLPIERRAAVVRLDIEAIAAPFAKGDSNEQEIARQISDTHVRAVTLVTGLGHDDFVSQLLVETDGIAAALLNQLADRPLKAADLAVIPRDATLAMAVRVDPSLLATGLRLLYEEQNTTKEPFQSSETPIATAEEILKGDSPIFAETKIGTVPDTAPQIEPVPGDTTPPAIDTANLVTSAANSPVAAIRDAMTRLCRKPTITLDNQVRENLEKIAASIGDTWRVYTSPGEGSSVFNGMTGVVRVKNRDRLTKTLDDLVAHGQPESWMVRKVRFAEHDIYYLVRKRENNDLAVVPSCCLIDNELVVSFSPQNVKAYLLRKPGGPSLADEPVVVEALRAKQPPTLLAYEDSREMFRLTYPLMQGLATAMAGQAGLPAEGIDPMLLPAGPTIAKYLRPAVSMASITPKGVQLTLHQSLPNGNLGATLYVVFCSVLPADADTLQGPSDSPVESAKLPPVAAPCLPCAPCPPAGFDPYATHNSVPPTAAPGSVSSPMERICQQIPTPPGSATAPPTYAPNPSTPPSSQYTPSGYSANSSNSYAPGPTYPSTSTPEPCIPPRRASPSEAPLWTPPVANAPGGIGAGLGLIAGGPLGTPLIANASGGYMPAAPAYGNPPPNGYGNPPANAPVSSRIAPPNVPAGYAPVVVYVPMVIYVPSAYAASGNPPTPYAPAYPPPGPPPGYAPPAYTPHPYSAPYTPPTFAPPSCTPGPYSAAPATPYTRYEPAGPPSPARSSAAPPAQYPSTGSPASYGDPSPSALSPSASPSTYAPPRVPEVR